MKSVAEVTSELFSFWRTTSLSFVAKYLVNEKGGRFIDLRVEGQSGKLKQPNGYWPFVSDPRKQYENGKEYRINCVVASDESREKWNNEFALILDRRNLPRLVYSDPREVIKSIYQSYTNVDYRITRLATGLLTRIAHDINKEPATFIYELLQNADDYPAVKGRPVSVNFTIAGDYLTLMHNGLPFSENNVEAICSANAGDKKSDTEQIGFKGIGFKSVFKLSNYVVIQSGGYAFRFDEAFHQRKRNETFWQVIPLWTEQSELDEALQTPEFLKANVSIAIRPNGGEEALQEIESLLKGTFEDERIMLFLRHVSQISFQGKEYSFTVSRTKINWEISPLAAVEVPGEIREELNRKIEKEDPQIPEKFASIQSTRITFAAQRKEGCVTPVEQARLYVYLPTKIDFGFPFIINGDFIPDGGRQYLHADLEWNRFLLKEAGKQFIVWLQQLWSRTKDINIIKLLPNLPELIGQEKDEDTKTFLKLFQEGVWEAANNIAFVPDQTGELRLLSELLEDGTGFAALLGVEKFKVLTGHDSPVMHSNYFQSPILIKMTEELSLSFYFGKEDLIEAAGKEAFQQWLLRPLNNIRFLKFLSQKSWMADFSKANIFLDDQGTLRPSEGFYLNMGDDKHLLYWLEVPILHPDIAAAVNDIYLPLKSYSGDTFIDDYILQHKEVVDEKLADWMCNKLFYHFLFRYHEQLLEQKYFVDNQLRYFKVFDTNYKCLSSFQEETIYFQNEDLKQLVAKGAVPQDSFYLLNSKAYGISGEDGINFWGKLGVRSADPQNRKAFIEHQVLGSEKELNAHYQQHADEEELEVKKKGNANLWQYLNESWQYFTAIEQKELVEKISLLLVFTSNEEWAPLKNCFLSSKYTGNTALEHLVEQNSAIQVSFVSNYYGDCDPSSTTKDWTILFRKFKVQVDEKDLVKEFILPSISTMADEDLVEATKLIFKYQPYITEDLSSLKIKLKTKEGIFIEVEKVFIGSQYTQTTLAEDLLSCIDISNQVDDCYDSKRPTEWCAFLQKIGAKALLSEEFIIGLKIKKCIDENLSLKDGELTFLLISELLSLFRQNKLTKEHILELRSLYVKLKIDGKNLYQKAYLCHFSKEYEPILNIEELFFGELPQILLSDKYISNNKELEAIKAFFKKIGVKETFEIIEEESKGRLEADWRYIKAIEAKNSKISSKLTSYSTHRLKPWKRLCYIEKLNVPSIAQEFWKLVISSSEFCKKVFENIVYQTNVGSWPVQNSVVWQLSQTECLPAKDGKCYKPNELFGFSFDPIIRDRSKVSAFDFSNVIHENKSLEDLLGLRKILTLDVCLEAFSTIKNTKKLKEYGVWEKIKDLLNAAPNTRSQVEKNALLNFANNGWVPNQLGDWRSVKDTFCLEPKLDIEIGRHEKLISKELGGLASKLGIKILTQTDFKPECYQPVNDGFKAWLMSHLKYVAVAELGLDWEQLVTSWTSKLVILEFFKTKGIKFCYRDTNPTIENTEATFYIESNKVYYLGSWNGIHAQKLFSYLHDFLGLKRITLKTFTDLIVNKEEDILELFESKNIEYPESWKLRPAQLSSADTTSTQAKTIINHTPKQEQEPSHGESRVQKRRIEEELSPVEIAELEGLMNRNLTEDEMANLFIVALFRGIKHYEVSGYDVEAPKANMEECVRKRMLEGVVQNGTNEFITVLVRSAKKGILHLNYQAWADLNNSNTQLFVVSGNGSSDYLLFQDQKSLSNINNDSWVAKIGGDDKYGELSSLINGEYLNPDKKFAPLQFLIRLKESGEYQSIFERMYTAEKPAEFGELD